MVPTGNKAKCYSSISHTQKNKLRTYVVACCHEKIMDMPSVQLPKATMNFI